MRRLISLGCSIVLLALFSLSTAAQDATTTITVWGGWGTYREGTLTKLIELFHEAQPNIRIERHEVTGDMDGLIVQILGGAAPDIYMVRAETMGGFIQDGLVLDLTPYFERDLNLEDFLPAWGSMSRNGRYYGVPAEGGGYRTDAMCVNRDLFAQAGIAHPGPEIEDALTYDEWEELARRLTIDRDGNGEPEQWGTHFSTSRWYQFLLSNGVSIFNEDWSDTEIDTPQAIEVLERLQRIHYHDRLSAPNSYWFEGQGNVAMNILWRSRVAAIPQVIGDKFDWSLSPLPAGEAGSVGLTSMNPFAINPHSSKKDAAWEFLRFTLSEEGQRVSAIEGRATVLRAVALDPEFVFSDEPPYNLMPFLGGDAVDGTRQREPQGVRRPAAIGEILQQLWRGEIPAAAAAQQMAQVWRSVL